MQFIDIQAPMTIRIDRPFVLLIHKKHSGAVLFAGMNPPQEN